MNAILPLEHSTADGRRPIFESTGRQRSIGDVSFDAVYEYHNHGSLLKARCPRYANVSQHGGFSGFHFYAVISMAGVRDITANV